MPTYPAACRPGGGFARTKRLNQLFHHGRRLFVVPLDHSVTDGPVVPAGRLDDLIRVVADAGADAVVLHKGCLRRVHPDRFRDLSLIVHLSAGTVRAPDPDAKYLVATVEEALRLGADAVSVHVNLGSRGERRQLSDLATVAGACERWSVPLLAMVYPRGPQTPDPRDPRLLAHAVAVAADLGADLVKTVYPGSAEATARLVATAAVPVLVAGGAPATDADLAARVTAALRGGATGIAVGRGVFRAPDPAATAAMLADAVHTETTIINTSDRRATVVDGREAVAA